MNEQETITDIIRKIRAEADHIEETARGSLKAGENYDGIAYTESDLESALDLADTKRKEADRLEAAHRREAQSIERIVRDAIIDYNGMYPSAPNDEAERDLRERAARANAWLKQHGFEEEPFHWSKEETPCL